MAFGAGARLILSKHGVQGAEELVATLEKHRLPLARASLGPSEH